MDNWEQIRDLQRVGRFSISPVVVGVSVGSIVGAGLIFLNSRFAFVDVRIAFLVAFFMPVLFASIAVLIVTWIVHRRILRQAEKFWAEQSRRDM